MHLPIKSPTITVIALAAAFLSAAYAADQNQAKTSASAPPAQKQAKLIHMATLNTVEANREFQSYVQLLQAQRQAVLQLKDAFDKEKDAKKKQELEKKIDAAMTTLNENNQIMQKTYGFSVDRNYVLEIERANVYLVATDEEAAKMDKLAKEAEKEKGKDKGKDKEKKKK